MDILEWSRHSTHATTLRDFIASPCGKAALEVLRKMTVLQRATDPEPNLSKLALDHQFAAGFQAAVQALKNLTNLNPDQLAKMQRAREAGSAPSWGWVEQDSGETPDSAALSPPARRPRK
jgi:hypothetical protein